MTSVELLEYAINTAEKFGYQIRYEYLGGVGGGACEFAGKKWIFIDLALTAYEQLEQVQNALVGDPAIGETLMLDDIKSQISHRVAS